MSHRVLSVAAVVAVVSLGAVPAGAQTDVPRTPWGQPDLQGTWDFRSITPMERPDELADRAFLTEEEAAKFEQEAANWFADRWAEPPERTKVGGEVGKGFVWARDSGLRTVETRRTSLVVDPPDGKIPALTTDGQRRADVRAASQRGEPRFDSWTDLSLGVRCLMGFNAGPPHDAECVQQQHAAVADAGHRGGGHRDDSQRSRYPTRRASPPCIRYSSVVGGFSRPLGGRHPCRRDHELHRQDPVERLDGEPAARRAVYPGRCRHAPLPVHGRRS